jgi:hypothetical protein
MFGADGGTDPKPCSADRKIEPVMPIWSSYFEERAFASEEFTKSGPIRDPEGRGSAEFVIV